MTDTPESEPVGESEHAAAPPPTWPALDLRDRLLSALLRDPRRTLVGLRPDIAVITAGTPVVVLTALPDETTVMLAARIHELAQRVGVGTQLIAVGAGADLDEHVKRGVVTKAQQALGFHRLGLDGQLTKIKGSTDRKLPRLVAGLASEAPLGGDALRVALAHSQRVQEEEAVLARRLQGGIPWATCVISAVCIGMLILTAVLSDGNENLAFLRMGANSHDRVASGEVWRLLSSAFLHGGVLHLVFNMTGMIALGPTLENLLGTRRFIVLYFLAALGGSLASAFIGHSVVSVGASGAIFGLLAGAFGLTFRPDGVLPRASTQEMRARIVVPLVINVVGSFKDGIDLWCHFGGAAVGFALIAGGLMTRGLTPGTARSSRDGLWTALAAVASLTMAASVVVALLQGRPWEMKAALHYQRVALDNGVSVELPDVMASDRKSGPSSEMTLTAFGSLEHTPFGVEIAVSASGEVPADQLDQALDQLRPALDKPFEEGARVEVPTELRTIGGRRFLFGQQRLGALGFKVWFTTIHGVEVLIRVYEVPDPPASWGKFEDHLIDSLRVE